MASTDSRNPSLDDDTQEDGAPEDVDWHREDVDWHRIDVDLAIEDLRKQLRPTVDSHLTEALTAVDLGLTFLIHAQELLLSDVNGTHTLALAGLLARLRSLAISIRELVLLGQSDSASVLCRAFLEASEVAVVGLSDDDFLQAFSPPEPPFDDLAFWKKRIGYGNIYPPLRRAYVQAGHDEMEADHWVRWRKHWKDTFSGAVHSDASAAFQVALVPSLESPGYHTRGGLGSISAYSPVLFLIVVLELYVLADVFVELLVNGPRRPNFEDPDLLGRAEALVLSREEFHDYYEAHQNVLHPDLRTLLPEGSSDEEEEA